MQTNFFLSRQSIRNVFHCPENHRISRPPFSSPLGKTTAFSLIEVVLALGVVAFAFVALLGMLPVGLNAFNNSIDSTMETQMAQSVMSQLRQAKFSQLYAQYNDAEAGQNTTPSGAPSFFKPYNQPFLPPEPGYYYDSEGNAAVSSGTTVVNPVASTPAPSNYVYSVGVQVYYDSWNISIGNAITPPFNVQPENASVASTALNPTTLQPGATVVITIRKTSSPNVARIYTGYIGNNGF
jgi:type II secretory pathway pseudopilin PulG